MAAIAFERVEKVYPNGVRALADCCLEVRDGELLAIVGPSGSGKSTLLRLIAGLEAPTRGDIRIGGRRVNGDPPRDRDVAMSFQRPALYPHLTVRDNLAFPLRQRRVARGEINNRVATVAERLGVTDLLARRPGELSGGQMQRVALGRALVRQPRCYLLDEPLSHLDAALRLQLRDTLHSWLRETSITTLWVTHDQQEASVIGQRIVVLNHGVATDSLPSDD